MSPGAVFFFFRMWSEGGVRSGREWKCWTPLGFPAGSLSSRSLPALRNRAIVNVTAPLLAPSSDAPTRTVTVSPGLNGFVGTKLAPWPSECALSAPAWAPVFEPTTCTVPSALGGTPRKLTWVCGEATGVPAVGYTATDGVAPPELLASTSAPLDTTSMPAITGTARRFESMDHLSLDGDEKRSMIGKTRETDLSCGRSTRGRLVRGPRTSVHSVAAGRLHPLVELRVPVPARERHARVEFAYMRLDPLPGRHPHDQLGICPPGQRRVHRRRERAAETGVHVVDP